MTEANIPTSESTPEDDAANAFGHDDATTVELGDGQPSDEAASEPADELDDVTPEDYLQAAEIMAQQAAEGRESSDDGEPVSAREQRYRQRAQAAEADRDRLAELVESMQRAEVHRLSTGKLADPSDLWRDGAQLAHVLTDGHVDPGKIDALIATVLAEHPHWAAPMTARRGPFYSGASNTRLVDSPSPGFSSAFAPKPD